MRGKALLLLSVLFFLFINISKSQIFKELHSFQFFADSITNYSSIWVDTDQDYDYDLLKFSILNKPNQLYSYDKGKLNKASSVFQKDGGNANGACYADIDMDGDLDIFVYSIFGQKNYLYIQESKGLYRKDFTQEFSQTDNNAFYACFSDVNLDNFPDLIITDTELWNPKSIKKSTKIYYNDGRGNFSRTKTQEFFVPNSDTRSVLLSDVNQDGREDLLLLNFGSNLELYLKNEAKVFNKATTNFTINNGDYMDALSIDFDNDGDLDLFIANLKTGVDVYRNDNNLLFTKIDNVFRLDDFVIAGVEAIDLNKDGLMDIVLHKSFSTQKKVFINNSIAGNFIKLKLRANRANLQAVQAKVYVKTNAKDREYWQYKEVKANKNTFPFNGYDLHFGLGEMKKLDSVKIIWPDGTEQILSNLKVNEHYYVEQRNQTEIISPDLLVINKQQTVKDLSVSIVSDKFRYGEIEGITIFYENKGLVKQDVELKLSLSVGMKLFNGFPMPLEYTDNSFIWKIKDVPPQDRGIITLSVKTPTIESISAKEQKISALIEPILGDENVENNRVEVKCEIVDVRY